MLLPLVFAQLLLGVFTINAQIGLRSLQSLDAASGWELFSDQKIPTRKELIDNYVDDCAHFARQNALIPVHHMNANTVRIATYNVHFWCNPYLSPYKVKINLAPYSANDIAQNFDRVIHVIKKINADIVCLQEVLLFDAHKIKSTFESLGYMYQSYVHEMQWDHSFGGLIISKYPFVKTENKVFDAEAALDPLSDSRHCLMKAQVMLPNNNQTNIYTAHFDWRDETEQIRHDEVAETISDIKKNGETNCLVCGDFNAVRMQDYQYLVNGNLVWDLMNRDNMARTKLLTPVKALRLFDAHSFQDCFARGNIVMPKFSVWNGTVVDFIYLNKEWNLPVVGSYFYYSAVSDHLPVIMDCKIS